MTGADVLLMTGEPYDPEVARLMIYEAPGSWDLTWRQNHGQECVWCRATGEDAGLAPLGGAGGWRPYGCAPCRQVRSTFLRAYLAWKGHVQDCEPCRTVWCPDGWGLALAHEIAYEVTGKREPVFCACGCPLPLTSRRLRPYVETILISLRYSHTGPCHGPEVSVPASGEATR